LQLKVITSLPIKKSNVIVMPKGLTYLKSKKKSPLKLLKCIDQ